MFPRSLSLRSQLLLTIVGSLGATALVLTVVAYRAEQDNLLLEASRRVRIASESRAGAIERLVEGQQQRARGFLARALALCGEETPIGRTAWELDCSFEAIQEFRATERAVGAVLTYGPRRVARSGRAPSPELPVPIPLARLVPDLDAMHYVV